MYTTVKTQFAATHGPTGQALDSRNYSEAPWVIATALLVIFPTLLLFAAVDTAPLPERLLDAFAFGGALVLLWAAWQSAWLDEIVGLFLAAVIVAVLGVLAPAAGLLVGVVSLILWRLRLTHH